MHWPFRKHCFTGLQCSKRRLISLFNVTKFINITTDVIGKVLKCWEAVKTHGGCKFSKILTSAEGSSFVIPTNTVCSLAMTGSFHSFLRNSLPDIHV